MRDDHYRKLCDNPMDYDQVVDWIKQNNPYAPKAPEGAEEFATTVVHDCIRTVVFGDEMWSSTGMCIAVRMSSNPERPNFKKVLLAIKL